jgi:trehalose 6-phosphate phosphatase
VASPDPLAPLRDDPHATALLTDFDGTLADIVDDPYAARPIDGAADVLESLAARYGRVGVISGRPAAFLSEWFGGRGVWLSGLYGLEHVVDGTIVVHPDAERWRKVVAEAADRAEREGPSDMLVERKGLSVTLHFRVEPELEAAVRACAAREVERTGLIAHDARMSVELRPPADRSKGTAVRDAATGMSAACFIGDDRGDLDAFDALDVLAQEGVAAVRVAVTSAEVPRELMARADVTVDGPRGALALLRSLVPAPS